MTRAAFVVVQVGHRGQSVGPAAESVEQRGEIAGTMVVDVSGPEHVAGELLEVEVFFVTRVVRSDDAELAAALPDFVELLRDVNSARDQETGCSLPSTRIMRRLQPLGASVKSNA